MSYKVLYRKYRPNTFKNIVGQKAIVDNLQKSVTENTFSHAYIFTGPRGTGKTSTAKVLAKALTCTNAKEGEPCGECDSCRNFSTSPDIIEIDAASNNGVDEIRELRNNITLAPTASKYKIYIIDEVHMLSSGAFNALLKTLEEPPSHAIFILATTEVYKVPITILSRCQRYDFKKIEKVDMLEHLRFVCNEEHIEYEDGVLEEIYELSEGCLRDALSILDQTSKSAKKMTLDALLKNYNMISKNSINDLLTDMKAGDVDGIITKIENYENTGINAQKLLKRMINYLEKIAIEIKMGKNEEFSFATISNLITNLNKCYIDARINENVFTIIKLCFLEAMPNSTKTDRKSQKSTEIVQKSVENRQETNLQRQTQSKNDVEAEAPAQEATKKLDQKLTLTEIRINNCFVEPSKEALNTLTTKWSELDTEKIKSLDIRDYKPVAASPNYAIFTAEENSLANLFNIKKDEIEKALKQNDLTTKTIAITAEDWQKEKEKYKNNLKSKKEYKYIDEPEFEEDSSELKKEAEELFTENLVEVS